MGRACLSSQPVTKSNTMTNHPVPIPRFIDRTTDKFESHKDWRETLQILVRGYSWDQVQSLYWQGRVPEKAWQAFHAVWGWVSFRYAGVAGDRQEYFWNRYGKAASIRRINRVRAAFGLELYPY